MIPKKIFFTKGIGKNKRKLISFESALRDAGIAQFNIVKVSSILPPNCEEISKEEGLELLQEFPGSIIYAVIARKSSNEKNNRISASIGVAKPRNSKSYGYLSEYNTIGQSVEEVGNYSEDLAACMLASSLGIPFDMDLNYDQKKELFKMSDKIVETKNITSSAYIDEVGVFTTVIAAAVFIL